MSNSADNNTTIPTQGNTTVCVSCLPGLEMDTLRFDLNNTKVLVDFRKSACLVKLVGMMRWMLLFDATLELRGSEYVFTDGKECTIDVCLSTNTETFQAWSFGEDMYVGVTLPSSLPSTSSQIVEVLTKNQQSTTNDGSDVIRYAFWPGEFTKYAVTPIWSITKTSTRD